MPKISIIIPVYNTAKYIAECLDSVLNQTFTDWEAICIDDGSTDNSLEILKEYANKDKRIKILTQKNQGVVVARNNGIKQATAELIYPLDSDDIIDKYTLEKSYNAIISKKGDIITCIAVMFGEKNGELKLPEPTKRNMVKYNCLVNSALFRKKDFIACGGYSEDCKKALEDYDLWLNLVFNHNKKIYRIPEILFFYRIKNVNESRNLQYIESHDKMTRKIYKKYPKIQLYKLMNDTLPFFKKFLRFFFRIQNNKIKIFKIPVYTIKKYDCCISVGAACFVPESLKKLNLRDFSGPFDWMWGSDIINRLKIIYDEFENYFNSSDFEYIGINPDNNKRIYKNIRTGIIYNHDFPDDDFDKTFPEIKQKYIRRINRTLNHLYKDKRILLVFAEFGKTGNPKSIIEMIKKINNKYPSKIDLLYINHNPNISLGKYMKPKKISKNMFYSEYNYSKFPDETMQAKNILIKTLKKIAK